MIEAESVLSEHLQAAGFKKKKSRKWLIDQGGLSIELELQRSRYGGRSFLNIGLFLADPVNINDPDVYTRLDVWLEREDLEDMLLDDNPNLEGQLSTFIGVELVPFVQQLTPSFMSSAEGHALLDVAQVSKRAAKAFRYV